MHNLGRLLAMLMMTLGCSMLAGARPNSAEVAPRGEVLLSGGDWELGSFSMGEGEKQGAYTESFQAQGFRTVTVPGEVQRQLGLQGMDQYNQSTELTLVNQQEWWYRKRFVVPREAKGKLVRLEFEGVDYFASVWLNGEKLGEHEGAFVAFSFDVSRKVAYGGENLLVLKVTCPWTPQNRGTLEYLKGDRLLTPPGRMTFPYPPYTLAPYQDDPPAYGNALLPMGLFRDVKLVISGWAVVEDLFVRTERLNADGSAQLRIGGTVKNYGAATVEGKLVMKIEPENFSGEGETLPAETLSLHAGENSLEREVQLKRAQLWWSWDLGKQNLYKLRASLSSGAGGTDTWDVSFGVRTIERKPDMSYWLNGQRVFVKGSWYPCADYLESKPTNETYETDLRLLRFANMNHLINFAVVERPSFYQWADRLGILLFVEFPFASMGPQGELTFSSPRYKPYYQSVVRQVHEVITRLRNHPSIIEWVAFAEAYEKNGWPASADEKNGGGWGGGGVAYDSQVYDALSSAVRELVTKLDPGTIYHPSMCDFGEHHFWMGNGGMGTTGNYTDQFDAKTAFVSEYGSLALPPYESLQKQLSPEDLWSDRNKALPQWFSLPINVAAYAYHTSFEYDGLFSLLDRTNQYVDRHIQSARQLVEDTELYQGFLLKYAAEAYREKLHRPVNGIRIWEYMEVWPGTHWEIVDYYRVPNLGFYYVGRAQEQFSVSFGYKEALESQPAGKELTIPVWLVNEYRRPVQAAVRCEIVDLEGRQVWSQEFHGSVDSDASHQIGEVDWQPPEQAGVYVLRGTAEESGGPLRSENSTFIKVTPKMMRDPVRVLVIGEAKYNIPIVNMLQGMGLNADEVDEEDFHQLARLRDAAGIRQAYDVVWLASFDSLWKLLDQEEANGLKQAIREGVGFIHTGGPGSYHGGVGMGACLEFTPLGEVLPVKLDTHNDVYYGEGAAPQEAEVKAPHNITDIKRAEAGQGWDESRLRQYGVPGFNKVELKPDSQEVMSIVGEPLLVLGHYGQGRTVAFTGFTPAFAGGNDQWIPELAVPYLLDQELYNDPETPGYFDIFMQMIAAVTGKEPAVSYKEMLSDHEKPLFETLKDLPPGGVGSSCQLGSSLDGVQRARPTQADQWAALCAAGAGARRVGRRRRPGAVFGFI